MKFSYGAGSGVFLVSTRLSHRIPKLLQGARYLVFHAAVPERRLPPGLAARNHLVLGGLVPNFWLSSTLEVLLVSLASLPFLPQGFFASFRAGIARLRRA